MQDVLTFVFVGGLGFMDVGLVYIGMDVWWNRGALGENAKRRNPTSRLSHNCAAVHACMQGRRLAAWRVDRR